ncbi:MAG: hypothetical protein Q9222_000516 [Ikaeria aurantiellina]
MADPFSAIGTTIKLAEFCLRLKEVSLENRVFLTLIARVRKDVEEALRERQEKALLLESMPEKRAWIDDAILDAQKELNSIGRLVEDARIDTQQGKPVTLKHRFEWVLTNHQKFTTEERALATFHQSLLAAMNVMHNLTAPARQVLTISPPTYQASINQTLQSPDGDSALLRSPSQRRPGQLGAAGRSDSGPKPTASIRSPSALSLPDIESTMNDSWSDSLLQVSLHDHGYQDMPKLSHTVSNDSFDAGHMYQGFMSNQGQPSNESGSYGNPTDPSSSIPRNLSTGTIPQTYYELTDNGPIPQDTAITPTLAQENHDNAVLQERRRRARSRYQDG